MSYYLTAPPAYTSDRTYFHGQFVEVSQAPLSTIPIKNTVYKLILRNRF